MKRFLELPLRISGPGLGTTVIVAQSKVTSLLLYLIHLFKMAVSPINGNISKASKRRRRGFKIRISRKQ